MLAIIEKALDKYSWVDNGQLYDDLVAIGLEVEEEIESITQDIEQPPYVCTAVFVGKGNDKYKTDVKRIADKDLVKDWVIAQKRMPNAVTLIIVRNENCLTYTRQANGQWFSC